MMAPMRFLALLAFLLPLPLLAAADCGDGGTPNPVKTPDGGTDGGTDAGAPSVPLAAGSPWPKFRANAAQDARSTVMPSLTGGALWTFQTGNGVFSSPIVGADGTVYVGSADQNFYAITAAGALLWKVETGEIIDSSGLLDDMGRVYFGSGDGILRACDAATGAVVWMFAADPPSTNSAYINWFEGNVAIAADGTLYVPNDNYFVYAVDRAAGSLTWKLKMPDQTWSLPAVDVTTGNLFVGNNELLSLLGNNTFGIAKDGTPIWQKSTPGTIAASPVLTASGTMVLGGFDGFVHAYKAADGTPLWSTATRDHVYASPALLPDGTIVQPSADGTMYALDPTTGAVLWTFDTPEPIRSSPAVDGEGNVYFGGGDGVLYVLNKDGSFRWSIQLIDEDRENLNASPALASDAIIIAGETGQVFSVPYDYCLRPTAKSDLRCRTTPAASGPTNGAVLVFSEAFGALDFTPPAQIDANQTLAFTLLVRDAGQTQLAILDSSSFTVTVTPAPAVPVTIDLAGNGKFALITPAAPFTPDANGNVTVAIQSNYLTNLTRTGLALSGGTVGGTVSGSFSFALSAPQTYPLALPVPAQPGDPSGVWELSRISLPLPTILPSYNQIGFDSLHYLIGLVAGTGTQAIAWMAGGKVGPTGATVIDPATQTLLPLTLSYQSGLLTLANTAGLTVNVQNVNIPLSTFRVSAALDATGAAPEGAHLSGSTICAQIPTYGVFLQQLGFCNPQTDVLSVFGGANLTLFGSGTATAPSGVGSVVFSATASAITATLTGSTLALADHVASVLLVDPTTGNPITLSYGIVTTRTATSGGMLATVSVPTTGLTLPSQVQTYLMVDTYPAAVGSVTPP
jgi:outer membrane protein assembly factor BamB